MKSAIQDMNLTRLEQEPIHLYNRLQPYGILLVLEEPDLRVLQVSSNAQEVLGIPLENIINQTLEGIFDAFQVGYIKEGLKDNNFDFINPSKIWARVNDGDFAVFDGTFHRNSDGFLILELEHPVSYESIPFLSFYNLAKTSISKLQETTSVRDFCQIIVQEVRKITSFDRVMLYQFDENNNGAVIAEDKLENLESYYGLRYPESDIPAPARRLLTSNWIRIIPDAQAEAIDLVPLLNPITGKPLDLTFSTLRSPSPCHLEYLYNMGVGSSLTISLIKDNKLWGLIACHHQTTKFISYELRKACEFLGRVFFAEISSREETEDYDYRMKLNSVHSLLVDSMTQEENFVDGLVKHDPNLLELTNAQGAAICFGGNYTLIGKTPLEEDLDKLIEWLRENVDQDIFYTESLADLYPEAIKYKDIASGLLVIPISKRNYVIWFRQEVIQSVSWGGNPYQSPATELSLCPRKSFDLWKETVRGKSLPWKQVEVNAALGLRKVIVNIVLRQADELARLAQDLERSNAELKKFVYFASHDLQEPLNQVSNYVQLLEMRYREKLDQDAEEFINFAVEGVNLMQSLIDGLLAYSKVDLHRNQLAPTEVEVPLKKAMANLRGRIAETGTKITHDLLPTVMADSTQLTQLFQNLLGNAMKFHSDRPTEIHIGAKELEDSWLFSVQDNGIGIDPQFAERIFVIFQRLHARDEYQGTGMGLAICQKIVEFHHGSIWVESELDRGATFYFTIPKGGEEGESTSHNYLASGRQ